MRDQRETDTDQFTYSDVSTEVIRDHRRGGRVNDGLDRKGPLGRRN